MDFETAVSRINSRLQLLPGFELFTVEDVQNFIDEPKESSFVFKKETGKGYLYGLQLAHLRRGLFNALPEDVRRQAILKKINFYFLEGFIGSFLDFGVQVRDDLVDVIDIGMGHSVFKLQFSDGTQVVLKQCKASYEPFYSQVLAFLGLPSIQSQCIQSKQKSWMVSQYIDSSNLNDYLEQSNADDDFVTQLAQQAAIGDCFGRGDRHFENYIYNGQTIYPLDISHLFWPDNEEWVSRYIKGGQSEFCILDLHNFGAFWDAYEAMWTRLKESKYELIGIIQEYFTEEQANVYSPYISSRLDDERYVYTKQLQVEESLKVFHERQVYKKKLEEKVAADSSILTKNPLLAMYYFSNLGRMTSFFLIEHFEREYLFQQI